MQYTKLLPDNYPYLLKQLDKQPPYLYIAGAPIPYPDKNYKFLCVVGARKYSDYGKRVCYELIRGLKNYPIVIVSGLALGIDSLAHTAALENGLQTIAIPGSGLDDNVIYPRSHYLLAKHIIESGNTLLSPFEPDQNSTKWTFPVRNQLMAGISHATLVIEGRQKSGTLLTAQNAIDMNRDVYIVPGSIFSDLSYGPHTLYSQGAKPVMNAKDILEYLDLDIHEEHTDRTVAIFERAMKSLPDDQKIILRELQFKPMSSTDLIDKLGISATYFNVLATKLELYGIISESHGIYKIDAGTN
ncbi:MAG: DNA-processing protein DprA [Candidatus Taylorbacteria bacterium]